jgi:hypothetical protein
VADQKLLSRGQTLNLYDQISKYLNCRIAQQRSIDELGAKINAIDGRFSQAIEYGAEEQKPDARRRFGNFLTRLGRPCDAKVYLQYASSSPSLQGLQAIKGWLDAVEACTQDPEQQDRAYLAALDDLKGAVEEAENGWLKRAAKPLLHTLQYLLLQISEKQIIKEDVYPSWSVLRDQIIVGWCGIAPEKSRTPRDISLVLKKFRSMQLAACRVQ